MHSITAPVDTVGFQEKEGFHYVYIIPWHRIARCGDVFKGFRAFTRSSRRVLIEFCRLLTSPLSQNRELIGMQRYIGRTDQTIRKSITYKWESVDWCVLVICSRVRMLASIKQCGSESLLYSSLIWLWQKANGCPIKLFLTIIIFLFIYL